VRERRRGISPSSRRKGFKRKRGGESVGIVTGHNGTPVDGRERVPLSTIY